MIFDVSFLILKESYTNLFFFQQFYYKIFNFVKKWDIFGWKVLPYFYIVTQRYIYMYLVLERDGEVPEDGFLGINCSKSKLFSLI